VIEQEGKVVSRFLAFNAALASAWKAASLWEALGPRTVALELISHPCLKLPDVPVHWGWFDLGFRPIALQ
jgi:hypothetical protein